MNKKDLPAEYQPSQPQVRSGACPYRMANHTTVGLSGCLKQDCLAFGLFMDKRPYCRAMMCFLD